MVEDVGLGLDHGADVVLAAVEVADEDLDAGAGVLETDLADRLRHHSGAAVGEVVARDHGDHDVLEAHLVRRLGDPPRLIPVGDRRPPGVDGAEPAVPRAHAAEDHEGGRAERPALALVRAAGLLADGVEGLGAQDAPGIGVGAADPEPHLEPLGTPAARAGILGERVAWSEQAAIGLRAAGVHHLGR